MSKLCWDSDWRVRHDIRRSRRRWQHGRAVDKQILATSNRRHVYCNLLFRFHFLSNTDSHLSGAVEIAAGRLGAADAQGGRIVPYLNRRDSHSDVIRSFAGKDSGNENRLCRIRYNNNDDFLWTSGTGNAARALPAEKRIRRIVCSQPFLCSGV